MNDNVPPLLINASLAMAIVALVFALLAGGCSFSISTATHGISVDKVAPSTSTETINKDGANTSTKVEGS